MIIRQGHGEAWEAILTRATTRSREENDPVQIDFQLQLGTLYRLQGRLPEAQQCFKAALQACDQYDVQTHRWQLLGQQGLVARLSGQHEEALAYCRQVLAIKQLPSRTHAEALNVMGLVAHDQRRWTEARHFFESALTLYRSMDDPYEIARILTNRGIVLERSDRWDEAEESYLEAIELFQAAGHQIERYKAVMNLGNVYLRREDYTAAIGQYRAALPIFEQSNYLIDLAHTYNNLGMAYEGLGDLDMAEPYFWVSINLWERLDDAYNLANTFDNLGHMFIKAEQPLRAAEILNQALQILMTSPNSRAFILLRQVIENRLAKLNGHS
jgi:tetratricopeptide (TPR) repeat protein